MVVWRIRKKHEIIFSVDIVDGIIVCMYDSFHVGTHINYPEQQKEFSGLILSVVSIEYLHFSLMRSDIRIMTLYIVKHSLLCAIVSLKLFSLRPASPVN